jgi:hypothetical protein
LATAEEAYYANEDTGHYADEDVLVTDQFLHKESKLHDITNNSSSYEITDTSAGGCDDNSGT